MKKVMVGMSGGVDSSVAALLLKQQGYHVVGATFKLFDEEDLCLVEESSCCSIDDVTDAKIVCETLGIFHYVLNFKDLFKEKVMDKFANSYLAGETPNPCVDCNRFIKFDAFYEKASSMGFDYIATGHYGIVEKNEDTGRYILKKSKFAEKDQSYALYFQKQESLEKTLMPLGEYKKEDIRKIAKENNLIVAGKKDSQDICFVPDGDYAGFLKKYKNIDVGKGKFIDKQDKYLADHNGYYNYTIGQRRGLGVGFGERKYVTNINPGKNTVTIGDNVDLNTDTIFAGDLNWISIENLPSGSLRCTAKFRYTQKDTPVTLYKEENGVVKVVFDFVQRAPAKGQAVVFYDGDTLIGGGTIL